MAETEAGNQDVAAGEDMHWGISYLREDLQEVKEDLRDFRREVAQEFSDVRKVFVEIRRDFAQQMGEQRRETGELRKEVAQQIADVRRDLRHNLFAMIGVSGVFATIIIAFIEYRLPAG